MTCPQDRPVAVSTPVHSEDHGGSERFDVEQAICEALATCDYSHKAAAITMEMDPSQFSRELRDGHVRLDRMQLLPKPIQRAFVERWASAIGLQTISADAQRESVRRLLRVCADVLASHEGL